MQPLLGPAPLAGLRTALTDYTPDTVHELLGPAGRAAHSRGDLTGVEYAITGQHDSLATLVRLFLLGRPVPLPDAEAALRPVPPASLAQLLSRDGDEVRARFEVRPYAAAHHEDTWWVVSDFGTDVRHAPVATDFVPGIGAASVTLAQATVRAPVGRALDVGTGCGVQALHLAEHAGSVLATDVSDRALALAATTAALSGQHWQLRRGSLLDPVAGEQFDLIVANPPFVVGPVLGGRGHDYRDGGTSRDESWSGDAVSRRLPSSLPARLRPGGCAQLLANWEIRAGQQWDERVTGWLAGRGVDAWVWQREVAEPGEYVSLWLTDAGEKPGSQTWQREYSAWLDWFAATGVHAVGMGLITMWRSGAGNPEILCEDVPQQLAQPVGPHVAGWIARHRWLAAHQDEQVLAARLRRVDGVVRKVEQQCSDDGWHATRAVLAQSTGMRWEVDVDDAVAAVVAGCDGRTPLFVPVGLIAAELRRPAGEVTAAIVPVIRDLIGRGFLEPATPPADGSAAAPPADPDAAGSAR